MSQPLSEAEILSVPVLIEVGPGTLVIRASRKHRDNVKLLLQHLREFGLEVKIQEEGLYCHYCEHHPVFQTEEEWEAHKETHKRYCGWPGCPETFIPEIYGIDPYFCQKHEQLLDQGEQPYWRI